MAQLQDMVADGPIAAVVKVDAQQADELATVLDEKGAGAEVLTVDVDAVIVEMIVRMLIALVPENTQGHIGQRRADLPAADIIIGDGDDGTVLPGQIVEGHFIVGTQRFPQKFGQLDVMLKDQAGRGRHKIPSFHFAYFQAMKILYMRKSYCQSKK